MTRHNTLARVVSAACTAFIAFLALCSTGAAAADKGGSAPSAFSVGGEWGSYNKSFDGQRYSLLRQINTSNATQLADRKSVV